MVLLLTQRAIVSVIAMANDLGVTVVAYSPLGRGFLTGQLKKEDIPQGDLRHHFARFQDEVSLNLQCDLPY
jgi:aryl-alcohol dehydrogenase-like predicted oxidoreductase